MDRFSSKEDAPNWNQDAFDDGSKARTDGLPQNTAPSAETIGVFARRSWLAGWDDADMGIIADGLAEKIAVSAV